MSTRGKGVTGGQYNDIDWSPNDFEMNIDVYLLTKQIQSVLSF